MRVRMGMGYWWRMEGGERRHVLALNGSIRRLPSPPCAKTSAQDNQPSDREGFELRNPKVV
jgi:hypothetical protein